MSLPNWLGGPPPPSSTSTTTSSTTRPSHATTPSKNYICRAYGACDTITHHAQADIDTRRAAAELERALWISSSSPEGSTLPAAFRAVLRTDSRNVRALYEYSTLRLERFADADGAIRLLHRALNLGFTDIPVWIQLARCYQRRFKVYEAISIVEEGLALLEEETIIGGEQAHFTMYRGYALAELQFLRYQTARADQLRLGLDAGLRALQIQPAEPATIMYTALTLDALGRSDEADRKVRRALRASSSSVEARFHTRNGTRSMLRRMLDPACTLQAARDDCDEMGGERRRTSLWRQTVGSDPCADGLRRFGDGGWGEFALSPKRYWEASQTDAIDRRVNLTADEFEREYVDQGRPVVLLGLMDDWPGWSKLSKQRLLADSGHVPLRVSRFPARPGGKHGLDDYKERGDPLPETPEKMEVREFVARHFSANAEADAPSAQENHPYLLDDTYEHPAIFRRRFGWTAEKRREQSRIFFGPANAGDYFPRTSSTGHYASYSALFYGTRRWFIFPPGVLYGQEHDSMRAWLERTYPMLHAEPFEYVQRSGEVLFVPETWRAGGLNLRATVGVTVALGFDRAIADRAYRSTLDERVRTL